MLPLVVMPALMAMPRLLVLATVLPWKLPLAVMLMWTSLLPVAVMAAFWMMPLSAIKLSVASVLLPLANTSASAMVMLPAPVEFSALVVLMVTLVPALMAVWMVLTCTMLLVPAPPLGVMSAGLVPVTLLLALLEMVMSEGSSSQSLAITRMPSVLRTEPEVSTKPPVDSKNAPRTSPTAARMLVFSSRPMKMEPPTSGAVGAMGASTTTVELDAGVVSVTAGGVVV